MENTPHGHKSFQVYLKGQYSARYFFSLILMIYRIISIRQSACLQMTVCYTEKKLPFRPLLLLLNKKWKWFTRTPKCFVMRLTHAGHLTRFNYILGDKLLQETDNHPYDLGVHITKDLTWNKHIHQITATANRTLAFVRRNLYSCPKHIKKSAYTTLVRPHLEYSSSVWDPHSAPRHS